MGNTTLGISQSSKIKKVGRLALAIAFGVAIGATAIGPAFAGGHGHDDRHHEHHRDHRDHDRAVYVAPAPSYYYAPAPDYYSAPEPEYYPPAYGAPPPPSEGINLFFGIHH